MHANWKHCCRTVGRTTCVLISFQRTIPLLSGDVRFICMLFYLNQFINRGCRSCAPSLRLKSRFRHVSSIWEKTVRDIEISSTFRSVASIELGDFSLSPRYVWMGRRGRAPSGVSLDWWKRWKVKIILTNSASAFKNRAPHKSAHIATY